MTWGDRLRRIPDGETGARTNWINFQFGVFAANPGLEPIADNNLYAGVPHVKLRAGNDPKHLAFSGLGYAKAAKASYETFAELKRQGAIGSKMRFQVSLPTPLAPVHVFVVPEDYQAVEPGYETRMLAELDEIARSIPHEELAIQWDVAVEIAILEGVWYQPFSDVRESIVERLVRLGDRVPAGIALGYHFCYGDARHQHFAQPADMSLMVGLANVLTERLAHRIDWLHMPVPRDRDDAEYFAPLRDLHLSPHAELYLGLVHLTDGVDGARRRIAAAQPAAPAFGISTECGMGRRPPETIVPLLTIHAEIV